MILINMDFRLTLDTKINLTGATTNEVQYIKPGAAAVAVLPGTITETTKIYADITDTINDTVGKWLFRCHVVIGGLIYFSTPVYVNVREAWHPWDGV